MYNYRCTKCSHNFSTSYEFENHSCNTDYEKRLKRVKESKIVEVKYVCPQCYERPIYVNKITGGWDITSYTEYRCEKCNKSLSFFDLIAINI